MKTFDIAGELEKVDTKAFEISNEVAKSSPRLPSPEVFAPHFNNDALKAQLDNAYNTHVQANLPKPEVEVPGITDTLKAAFQMGNTVGSALSSQTFGEQLFPTRDSPELTDDQILDRVGKAGLMPLVQRFQGVTNEAQFEARLDDIQREQKNADIMEASGATGVVAMLAAGIIDVPTLLPVGKALQLGKAGASFLEATARTAAAGTIDAGISEAGLQATQQLRTNEDAVLSVASGAILGGVLGAGVHRLMGGEIAAKVEGNLDKYRADAANNFPEARAAVDRLEAEVAKANVAEPPEPLANHDAIRVVKTAAIEGNYADAMTRGMLKYGNTLDLSVAATEGPVADIVERLRSIGVPVLKASVKEGKQLTPKLQASMAYFDKDTKIVAYKSDTDPAQLATVLQHEELHALVDKGILSKAQLETLANAAKKIFLGKSDGSIQTLHDNVVQRYGPVLKEDAARQGGRYSASQLKEVYQEEAAAHLLQDSRLQVTAPEAKAIIDGIRSGQLHAEWAAKKYGVETTPKSVGAAATPWEELKAEAKAHGEQADAKVSAGLFDKVPSITTMPTEWLGKFLGGKTLLGQPRQAFRSSPLDTVRQFGRMFYSAPEISEANTQGLANSRRMTVEDRLDKDRTNLGIFKAEVENIYAANKARFKSAKDLAQRAYYAALNEGVDKVSGDAAIEAVARSFRKYADYQRELHVKNGKLPEDLDTIGADGYVRRVYNQTALRNDKGRAMSMLEAWATKKVTADVEEELAHTQYTERLQAHDASVSSYEQRVEFWNKHPERLKDWENRRDIARAQDKADFQTAMANWRDRNAEHGVNRTKSVAQDEALFKDAYRVWEDKVREFLSDPANDGKAHPYMLEKPKRSDFKTFEEGYDNGVPKPKKPLVGDYDGNIKSFDTEFGPRPLKGKEPLVTEGNAKPAVPKGKYGVPMLREHIPAYSKALAQDVYDTIAGVRSAIPNSATSRVRIKTGYLQGRVIDIADEALAENFFLQTDLLEHAELMHNTSGKQAAFGSVFKTVDSYGNEVGDYTGNSILVDIAKEAQAKIDAASGDELTKLTLDRDKHLQGVKNEIEQFLGTYDPGKGFGLLGPKAAHTLASVAYDVRLGGVTASSLTDAPKIAIAHGLGDTFKYGVLPMFTDFRNAIKKGGVMREQGIRIGTATEALNATRMRDAYELNNPHQVGDKWVAFVDKTTQWATRMSGIATWTDWMKQITHNVVSSRILKYSTVGHERLSKKNTTWLANIGLEARDLAKIKEEYGNQDLKHVAGILYADLDKWKDQDLAARFERAMRIENRNTIVTPGLGDKPQFTYDATGKLMYQFQTFMMTEQTRFLARQVQLANVGTDAAEKMRQRIALGAGLSSLVLASVFVDSLKRALRDNDADWEAFTKRWSDNPGGSMYDALDRSGLMGSLFTASNTVGKFSNGQFSIRGGTQWLSGDRDRGEARKVRDIGLGGALLGPGAGMAEDVVRIGQAGAKAVSGGNLSRADLRRFQNTLPYHAVPGIQQALNALNSWAGDGLGLPPEQQNLGH